MGLRRPEDHYTYSKVMASVALDRADQTAIAKQLPGDVDRWRSYAASIRRLVLDRGGVTSAERSCSRSRGRPARRRQPPLPAGWFPSSQRPAPELGGDSPAPSRGGRARRQRSPARAAATADSASAAAGARGGAGSRARAARPGASRRRRWNGGRRRCGRPRDQQQKRQHGRHQPGEPDAEPKRGDGDVDQGRWTDQPAVEAGRR